ncbi:DUF4089 domain-containing protein [Acidisoma cellulosilytica]|uniref:DUF4089 domain-containing protein n=1 Tax=Acidisoma cellulosilyticum TaxID=2802395 RepID=A0A964E365_9PROT|nr:AtzG-like protein [Acidisoma cellulosilyticum]MCB8880049.1 DUF4089 domain-containing protein [Acidisoma cellulosilyticum]
MDEANDIAAYVRAAANLQGLGLDEAELARVTAAFVLVTRFAEPVLTWPVDATVEPALVFQP